MSLPMYLWLDWFCPRRSGPAPAAPPAPQEQAKREADDQDYDDIA
jgi:hypothetical protein